MFVQTSVQKEQMFKGHFCYLISLWRKIGGKWLGNIGKYGLNAW